MALDLFHSDLFERDKLNNIASRFFQLSAAALFFIAAVAQCSEDKALPFINDTFLLSAILFIQAAFAAFIVLLGPPASREWRNDEIYDQIIEADKSTQDFSKSSVRAGLREIVRNFSPNWINLWKSWVLLYSWLFICKVFSEQLKSTSFESQQVVDWITNCFNAFGTYFMYLLYLTVRYRTEKEARRIAQRRNYFKGLLIGILALEAMLIASIYVVPQAWEQNILFTGRFFPNGVSSRSVFGLFQMFNGLIASGCLAMFIGRLFDSATIRIQHKELILPALYIYAGVQSMYIAVYSGQSDTLVLIVIYVIALLLKYLLYYVVTALFLSRIIAFYFIDIRSSREGLDRRFEKFTEIWTVKKVDNGNKQ